MKSSKLSDSEASAAAFEIAFAQRRVKRSSNFSGTSSPLPPSTVDGLTDAWSTFLLRG
jgi:hypothetical protein